MSEHRIAISWKSGGEEFTVDQYDRTHAIRFDGGQSVQGSAAPDYHGKAEHTNPEELLAASLSSCHMLTFLAVAAKMRLPVASYEDEAVAVLEKNEAGKIAVTKVTLRPKIEFQDPEKTPDAEKLNSMHEKAHGACMIANSVKTEVVVEPR